MSQHIDFFFDFVSPYTYLAQTQLPGLIARCVNERAWPGIKCRATRSIAKSTTR